MENVLIIGAHFDDAELGVGGTAAKLVSEGKKVYKLTLTDNKTNFKQKNVLVDYHTSAKASSKACKILGVIEITNFKYEKCNTLHYTTDLMQKIENIIFELNIDTVFIHYNNDINRDHVEASKICLTASRHCANVFFYQSNCYIYAHQFNPTFFVNITDFIEKKEKALEMYGKEHNRFGNMFQTNLERNKVWGYANHVSFAEGFIPVKFLY